MKEIEVSGRVLLDDEGDWSDATEQDMLRWLNELSVGVTLASDMGGGRASRKLRVHSVILEPK